MGGAFTCLYPPYIDFDSVQQFCMELQNKLTV